MTDPKWLKEDKELPEVAEWVTAKLRPMERQSATVEQLLGALGRAHAHIKELREALDRRSYGCQECGGYDEPVLTRREPPEVEDYHE